MQATLACRSAEQALIEFHRAPMITSRIFRVVGWCGALIVSCAINASGSEIAQEYRIKAAFVYNFTKFVEWPPERFASTEEPIVIGVLGKNPFGEDLAKAVEGRKVGGRSIVVLNVLPAAEHPPIHLLFVAAGEEKSFDPEMAPGALTVGESERFASLGGMITFISDIKKVRFMINLEIAERARLKLSAQLLKLASTVRRKA
jgi:hypothetical protein